MRFLYYLLYPIGAILSLAYTFYERWNDYRVMKVFEKNEQTGYRKDY